eukprot:m.1121593 g.1121593  ORF g.1121593 m.1121593 type:complete len:304 (+) comp24399_c0_seq7:3277-4188(+)
MHRQPSGPCVPDCAKTPVSILTTDVVRACDTTQCHAASVGNTTWTEGTTARRRPSLRRRQSLEVLHQVDHVLVVGVHEGHLALGARVVVILVHRVERVEVETHGQTPRGLGVRDNETAQVGKGHLRLIDTPKNVPFVHLANDEMVHQVVPTHCQRKVARLTTALTNDKRAILFLLKQFHRNFTRNSSLEPRRTLKRCRSIRVGRRCRGGRHSGEVILHRHRWRRFCLAVCFLFLVHDLFFFFLRFLARCGRNGRRGSRFHRRSTLGGVAGGGQRVVLGPLPVSPTLLGRVLGGARLCLRLAGH